MYFDALQGLLDEVVEELDRRVKESGRKAPVPKLSERAQKRLEMEAAKQVSPDFLEHNTIENRRSIRPDGLELQLTSRTFPYRLGTMYRLLLRSSNVRSRQWQL